MKKSLRIIRQDQALDKSSKRKLESKERDKNSTLDTYTNTKSRVANEEKKLGSSGGHNHSETTFSQMLCDLSYKEPSIAKTNTPKVDRIHDKPNLTWARKSVNLQVAEIEHALELKEKEIHELEKTKLVLREEIDNAIKYYEKNKNVPEDLISQIKQVETLEDQLKFVVHEIHRLKHSPQTRPIPKITGINTAEETRPNPRSKTKSSDSKSILRVKSLSPKVPYRFSTKYDKFKMYDQVPAKPSTVQQSKSKTSRQFRDHLKPFFIANSKDTNKKTSHPNIVNEAITIDHNQTKTIISPDFATLEFATTPREDAKYNKLRKYINKSVKRNKQSVEDTPYENTVPKKDSEKLKQKLKKAKRRDNSLSYGALLDNFAYIIDYYKHNNEILQEKNKNLESKIKKLNKTEINHNF